MDCLEYIKQSKSLIKNLDTCREKLYTCMTTIDSYKEAIIEGLADKELNRNEQNAVDLTYEILDDFRSNAKESHVRLDVIKTARKEELRTAKRVKTLI